MYFFVEWKFSLLIPAFLFHAILFFSSTINVVCCVGSVERFVFQHYLSKYKRLMYCRHTVSEVYRFERRPFVREKCDKRPSFETLDFAFRISRQYYSTTVHRFFYISICISTLSTEHTTFYSFKHKTLLLRDHIGSNINQCFDLYFNTVYGAGMQYWFSRCSLVFCNIVSKISITTRNIPYLTF